MVLPRHAQHLADHRAGDARGVVGDEVEILPVLQLVQNLGGQFLEIGPHALDHRAREPLQAEHAQAGVLGRVHAGEVVAEQLQGDGGRVARVLLHPPVLAEAVRAQHPVAVLPLRQEPEAAVLVVEHRRQLAQPVEVGVRVALGLRREHPPGDLLRVVRDQGRGAVQHRKSPVSWPPARRPGPSARRAAG